MIQPRLFNTPQLDVSSNDYYTPKWIFDALGVQFDLDVCCPPQGPLFTPCKTYYTQENDGLASDWYGTVWMNPPFSDPLPWVRRFVQHKNGIALVPTSNGKWQDILWNSESVWVTLPSLKFYNSAGGMMTQGLPNRCWLVAMGKTAMEALHESKIGRVR